MHLKGLLSEEKEITSCGNSKGISDISVCSLVGISICTASALTARGPTKRNPANETLAQKGNSGVVIDR